MSGMGTPKDEGWSEMNDGGAASETPVKVSSGALFAEDHLKASQRVERSIER